MQNIEMTLMGMLHPLASPDQDESWDALHNLSSVIPGFSPDQKIKLFSLCYTELQLQKSELNIYLHLKLLAQLLPAQPKYQHSLFVGICIANISNKNAFNIRLSALHSLAQSCHLFSIKLREIIDRQCEKLLYEGTPEIFDAARQTILACKSPG